MLGEYQGAEGVGFDRCWKLEAGSLSQDTVTENASTTASGTDRIQVEQGQNRLAMSAVMATSYLAHTWPGWRPRGSHAWKLHDAGIGQCCLIEGHGRGRLLHESPSCPLSKS